MSTYHEHLHVVQGEHFFTDPIHEAVFYFGDDFCDQWYPRHSTVQWHVVAPRDHSPV